MRIEQDIPLAPLTSLRLGGRARYLARCASADDLRAALEWAEHRRVPVHVLGGGSNTVFDDAGFHGLVLRVELRGVEVVADGDGAVLTAGAGEDWDLLVRRCIDADLSGVECLSGIPGAVGATPIQNVGAYGQEVSETVVEVRALARRTGREVTVPAAECGFGYRASRFKGADRGRFVITGVVYRLPRVRRPEIRYPELRRRLEADGVDPGALAPGREASQAVRAAVLRLRRAKSMVLDEADPNARSAGSFFLNPVLTDPELAALRARCRERGGDPAQLPAYPVEGGAHKVPAAWLVERAGFEKGRRRGGAAISERHALALVNRGGSTADLLGLADEVAAGVYERFGVRLEPEPVYVPPGGAPRGKD